MLVAAGALQSFSGRSGRSAASNDLHCQRCCDYYYYGGSFASCRIYVVQL